MNNITRHERFIYKVVNADTRHWNLTRRHFEQQEMGLSLMQDETEKQDHVLFVAQ